MLKTGLPMRIFAILLGTFLISVFSSPAARADEVTYTYTGNAFNPSDFSGSYSCSGGVGECSVSGSFTLSTALGDNLNGVYIDPTSFSFTDGNTTWTDGSSGYVQVFTNASGNITGWYITSFIGAPQTQSEIITFSYLADAADESFGCPTGQGNCNAYNQNDPGTWTESAAVAPEPGTFPLMLTGLLGFAVFALTRLRRVNTPPVTCP